MARSLPPAEEFIKNADSGGAPHYLSVQIAPSVSIRYSRLLGGDGPQQGRSILGVRSTVGRQYASRDVLWLDNIRRTSCREFTQRADGAKSIGHRRSRAAV